MSEEKNDQGPKDQPPTPPKKTGLLPPKKNSLHAFNKPKNNFASPKSFNSRPKGSGFKGGGVKKGK